ncbi:MAG: phosphopantetheine-binding protein [Acidobacteria bacterium]|jgi:acyl carrier protein|nr:phosphopantetheine-binding protein [Acidobacteriota bacterium]
MDKQATIQRLIEAVSKKKVSVAPDESLFDSGLLDSFALPDLVAALEQEYSIRIPDSDLNPRKFDTIERIEAYLDSLS